MTKTLAIIAVVLSACSSDVIDVELDEDVSEVATAPQTCEAVDTTSDPRNCGECGNACASGLCYAGVCADDRAGNVFVIGHSYRTSNPALDRVLGNAVFLKEGAVNVLLYRGTAATDIAYGTATALSRAGTMMKRTTVRTVVKTSPSIQILLPTAHVLVIEAQPHETDETLTALADEWSLPFDDFVRRGGIIVVLDAPSTTNTGTARVLGNLLPMTRQTTQPGGLAYVTAPENIAAGRLPLTFALGDSVGYAPSGHTDAVTSESGDVVVAHRAFY